MEFNACMYLKFFTLQYTWLYLCENAGIPVDLGKDDQMRRRERDPGIGSSDAKQRHLATLHRLKSKQYD